MNRAERRRLQRQGVNPDKISGIWLSNAVWAPTGYGTQTAQAVPRLRADGHDIAVVANYGLQAMQTEYQGIPHYPMGYEAYSNDVVEAYYKDWRREHNDGKPMVFVLFDAWPLKGEAWDRLPTAIWTMVDHMPVPPSVLKFLAKPNVTPIAVTRFGQEAIQRCDVDALYVPMAIDTDLYQPTPLWHNGTQPMTGWQLMGWDDDDAFTISIINANKGVVPSRKAWGENLLAASIFLDKHPDARLYLHTERHGNMGGIALDPLIKAVGLRPDQYKFVNQFAFHMGIPNEAMAAIYTSTDVLLAATLGEGFGLTTLEAASCGTRVIANNFSAQPEMVSDDSWLTEGQPWWDPTQLAWFNTPNVPSIVDALEQAYARGKGRSDKQREHAMAYDADVVYDEYWRPALHALANEPDVITAPVQGVPSTWQRNWPSINPRLTIYIPTFQRRELNLLLSSLAPQLTDQIEVVISDNDPAGSAFPLVTRHLQDTAASVEYQKRASNIGGDANIMRGYEQGTAPWVWVIGDDDVLLPDAIANVLEAIEHDDVDRLILLSRKAPSRAAGVIGTAPQIAAADPSLLIAATLITANVLRRSALNLKLGLQHLDTKFGHSWANTSCHRIKVLAEPCISVGYQHAGDGVTPDFAAKVNTIWLDLLAHGYEVDLTPDEAFRWNYASAEQT